MCGGMEGRKFELSDLPESILVHILSKLSDRKEVVRSSVLSTQWRYLWRCVPVSLCFHIPYDSSEEEIVDFVASTNRELQSWRFCEKIKIFKVNTIEAPTLLRSFVKDVNMWVRFSTEVCNVDEFILECDDYELPQFAYKNTSWKNLILCSCQLNPSGSVNWSSLASFSLSSVNLTDGFMEKILSGCPNLECLEIEDCCWGFQGLKISSVKLKKLIMEYNYKTKNDPVSLEVYAPYLQNMQLMGSFHEIRLNNVTSLVTAVLDLSFYIGVGEDRRDEAPRKLKRLLHSLTCVENVELGGMCIECLSILELKGLQFPQSGWKFLKLNIALEELDLPGICSFLQCSSDLEILVFDWSRFSPRKILLSYTSEDEQKSRFEALNFNSSLLHLKAIKFVNFRGPLVKIKVLLPLAKHLLKNSVVLEKFTIDSASSGGYMSRDFVRLQKKLSSFPRSSLHASVVLSNV